MYKLIHTYYLWSLATKASLLLDTEIMAEDYGDLWTFLKLYDMFHVPGNQSSTTYHADFQVDDKF